MFDRVKLAFLLRLSAWLVRRGARRSVRLAEMLAEEDFTMQVRTEGGAGGHFQLRDGSFRFIGRLHDAPDFEQVWRSPADAVRVMTSPDESAMNRAFHDRLCRMSGRFVIALWFNEATKIAIRPAA
ncbi:hypothetical protein KOAAANKH_00772 [Brevundimonas sp. NIBR10]|uniref:hypothetical protein n=1 Tax=Brevundimonas sp. NIBR10 TaxID=3015997 RepID=UPI0022F1D169|nr:hypothetical protein [Brevundimonas sp. NIBR10]WGM45907.1 hypothetical protein KOAAANKH_00772 [Brevundimonas sp. NIBR10]